MPAAPADLLYLVVAHRGYDQVHDLIRTLKGSGADVLLHLSTNAAPWRHTAVGELVGSGEVATVPRPAEVAWGDPSIYDAILRGFAQALQLPGWEWLVTISGQDFPVRPPTDLAEHLRTTPHDAFLEGRPLLARSAGDVGISLDEARLRYCHRHRFFRSSRPALSRGYGSGPFHVRRAGPTLTAAGRRHRSPEQLDRLFGAGFHVGSSWTELRRPVVEHVVERSRYDERIRDLWTHSLFPEEGILPSLVLEAAAHPEPSGATRFISWSHSVGGHPDLVDVALLEDALASGAYLARKFDFDLHPEVRGRLLAALGASR